MNSIIKFYLILIKLGFALALAGQLKTMTLAMAEKAVTAQKQMISYSKFTRMLTSEQAPRKKPRY